MKRCITERPIHESVNGEGGDDFVDKPSHRLQILGRRLALSTNAFSKMLENFNAAVALNFPYYSF